MVTNRVAGGVGGSVLCVRDEDVLVGGFLCFGVGDVGDLRVIVDRIVLSG